MKASLEFNKDVRSRDIQQFLNTYSNDNKKKFYIYTKNGNLCLTTELTEASTEAKSRTKILDIIKKNIDHKCHSDDVSAVLQDIRNLAKQSPSKSDPFLLEKPDNFITLNSGQLTYLLKHRSDPNVMLSDSSRPEIIENSIITLHKSLKKYSALAATPSDNRPEKWLKGVKAIGESLAKELTHYFNKEKFSANQVETAMFQISFFTNEGIEAIKDSIRDYCSDRFNCDISDDMLDAIATGLQESLENIQPKSIKKFDLGEPDLISLPQKLELAGETYNLVTPQYAGKGGHGFVHMYENNNWPKMLLAVKSPVNCTTGKQIIESNKVTQNELSTHLRAQGIGNENLVEVKGAFLSDGKMCIALEDCSLGVLDSFVNGKLNSNQDLSDKQKSLVLFTLGRDVLRGLNFLHEESNVMHLDFKPQNVFIGADGKAKIGDFDQSASGANVMKEFSSIPDTRQYVPPALLAKRLDYTAKIKLINDKYERLWLKEKNSLERKKIQAEKIKEVAKIDKFVNFSQGDDIYSSGVTLYEIFFGTNPFSIPGAQLTDADISVEKFGKMSDIERSDFLFKGKKIASGLESQEIEIKQLILGLMHTDSAKRLSLSDALNSPVFAASGIGSAEVREYIIKIGSPTSDE